MPHYNYNCNKCDHSQEEFRFISEREDVGICNDCGGEVSQGISSAANIHLDGSNPDFTSAHSKWVKRHETLGNGIRTQE
jgi:putative FmdB family regulatory protein